MSAGRMAVTPRAHCALGWVGLQLMAWSCLSSITCTPAGESEAARERGAVKPDVVLIVIDSLRADHIGAYGYEPSTSPNLDAFAETSGLYEAAVAQAPHTIPSMLQMMSSQYDQGKELAAETPTLAEMLSAEGYETAAIVENANFEFTTDARGLMRGFATFFRNGLLDREKIFQQHWKTPTPADVITAQARRWLQRPERDAPIFLWLHYFDPHDPYLPPYADEMEELSWGGQYEMTGDIRGTRLFPGQALSPAPIAESERQHLIQLYDAEIRYLDQSLGELFALLGQVDLFRDSLIIITADHGESLGEHGHWTHGTALFEAQIHVPLMVKYPRQAEGFRVGVPVETIDILPTVLDVANVETDARLDGRSLLNLEDRAAFVFWKDEWVVRKEQWKLLHRDGATKLFHLGKDPGETHDLAAEHPAVVESLLRAREIRLRTIDRADSELEKATHEAVREMKSLGYLD